MTEQKPKRHPKIVTQVDDFGRKKFTLKQNDSGSDVIDEDEQQQKFIDTGRHKSTLIGRQEKIDTDKYLGKIQGNKKKKKTQVFYCQVCKIGFKCDLAYITHINSPSHNRKLGMNMKTVSEKLARLAQQKNKSKQQKILEKKFGKNWQAELRRKQKMIQNKRSQQNAIKKQRQQSEQQQQQEENDQQNHDEERQEKQQRQDKQKRKIQYEEKIKIENQQNLKKQAQQQQLSQDPDQKLMRELGLPTNFGSKKKKY